MSRVDLWGMGIDPLTEPEAVERVLGALDAGRGGVIITPNVDHLRQFRARAELRELYGRADLVLVDGMPLVWALRVQGTPVPGRVPGSDLVWSLAAGAARRGRSVFLLGGDPGVAEHAARVLCARSPGLRVAGTLCPPLGFERRPEQLAGIRAALHEAQPDLVYLALGFPKSERLAVELRREVTRAWFANIGISLSFITGDVARAPAWMQRSGLEWVHRLAQEPRRLFTRYVVHDAPFALRLLAHALLQRARAAPAPSNSSHDGRPT